MTVTRDRPSHEFLQGIGDRIRQRRAELSLSLRDLKDRTDISLAFLSQLEHGVSEPGAVTLLRLSIGLKVTIDWLVKGTEEAS